MNYFSEKPIQELKQKKIEKEKETNIITKHFNYKELEQRIQKVSIKTNKERILVSQSEFIALVRTAKQILINQPSLLKLESPVVIATGTLGNYCQLAAIFEKCQYPKFTNYLFLGDYTGRYNRGIQCLVALLTYKVQQPYNFFLLRGCYQSISMSNSHELHEELIEYFGSEQPWAKLCQLFCCMPFAATVNSSIFAVHSGISPHLISVQQINNIKRPYDTPQSNLPFDILNSTPNQKQVNEAKEQQNQKKQKLQRLFGYTFCSSYSQEQVRTFLKTNNLQLMIRGHSVVKNGYQFMFEDELLTICTLSNYLDFYNNDSAVVIIAQNGEVFCRKIKENLLRTKD